MAEDQVQPLEAEDDDAPVVDTGGGDSNARVARILAAFNGKSTTITDAGRENMRTVNRLAKVLALRHVHTDKTFRHNLSRYHVEALEQDILIGARREGNGVWTLVAELTPRRRPHPSDE